MHGHPIYDNLQRAISPAVTFQSNSCGQTVHEMATVEHKQHHEVDLGELRGLVRALQDDVCNTEKMEIGAMEKTRRDHRRRFSVDLGEVREFIALREMISFASDEITTPAGQSEVQDVSHNEGTC